MGQMLGYPKGQCVIWVNDDDLFVMLSPTITGCAIQGTGFDKDMSWVVTGQLVTFWSACSTWNVSMVHGEFIARAQGCFVYLDNWINSR